MGRTPTIVGACLVIGLIAAPLAAQVTPAPPPPSGFGFGAGQAFNPATMDTIQGQIVDVQSVPSPGKGRYAGLHFTMQTANGPLTVYAGPEWYLQSQNVMFAPHDNVTVTGSRTTWAGQPALIAASIQRGDMTLQLRNPYGVPGWSGYGVGGGGRGTRLGPRARSWRRTSLALVAGTHDRGWPLTRDAARHGAPAPVCGQPDDGPGCVTRDSPHVQAERIRSATFLPDSSMPPKIGPILGPPNVAATAMPVTHTPG